MTESEYLDLDGRYTPLSDGGSSIYVPNVCFDENEDNIIQFNDDSIESSNTEDSNESKRSMSRGQCKFLKDDSRLDFSRREKNETTQDRLKYWNEYYASKKFGLWIECDNKACKKWRWVKEYEEAEQVPAKWFCYMNSDPAHNSCDAKEDKLPEDMYSKRKFEAGFIVWARVLGYPSWPAIIEDCPDNDDYFKKVTYHGVGEIEQYHVAFFDRIVTRAWVDGRNIRKFRCEDNLPALQGKNKKYKEHLKKAFDDALYASSLTLKERLDKYSFGKRHQGPFPPVDDDDDDSSESESDAKHDVLQDNLNETRDLLNEVDALDDVFKGLKDIVTDEDENASSGSGTYDAFRVAIYPVRSPKFTKSPVKKIKNNGKLSKSKSIFQKSAFVKSERKKKSEEHYENETGNIKEKVESHKNLELKRKIDFEPKNKTKKPKVATNDATVAGNIDRKVSFSSKNCTSSCEAVNHRQNKICLKSSEMESEYSSNTESDDKDMVIVTSSMRTEKISKRPEVGKFKSKKKGKKRKIMPETVDFGSQAVMENSISALKKLKITEVDELCKEDKVNNQKSFFEKMSDVKIGDKKPSEISIESNFLSNGNLDTHIPEPNGGSDDEPYDSDKEALGDYDLELHNFELANLQFPDSEQPKTGAKIIEEMAENNTEIGKEEKVGTDTSIEVEPKKGMSAKISDDKEESEKEEKDIFAKFSDDKEESEKEEKDISAKISDEKEKSMKEEKDISAKISDEKEEKDISAKISDEKEEKDISAKISDEKEEKDIVILKTNTEIKEKDVLAKADAKKAGTKKKQKDVLTKVDAKEEETKKKGKNVLAKCDAKKERTKEKRKGTVAKANAKKVEIREKENDDNSEADGKLSENIKGFDTCTEIEISKTEHRNDLESNENLENNGEQNGLIQKVAKSEDTSKFDDQKVEVKIERYVPLFSRKSKTAAFKLPMAKAESDLSTKHTVEESNKQVPPTSIVHDENDSTDESINTAYISATENSNLLDEVTMKNTMGDNVIIEFPLTNLQNEEYMVPDYFNTPTTYFHEDFGENFELEPLLFSEKFSIKKEIPDDTYDSNEEI